LVPENKNFRPNFLNIPGPTVIIELRFRGRVMVTEREPRTVYWIENKLYLNITNKCPNNCFFCIRNFRNGIADFNLRLTNEPSIESIIAELERAVHMRNWSEIVFCGFGEPTQRLDALLEITKWLRQNNRLLPVRLNTNGLGNKLNPRRDVTKEMKEAGITKVSVSLNAQNAEVYNEICRPKIENSYQAIIEFINQAKQELEIEITAITTPEVSLTQIEQIAKEMNVKFRIRPYIPHFW
jgi:TatD family-associated radical SAM protein